MQSIGDFVTSTDAWSWLDSTLRMLLAICAGAVLGWERERRRKPAGLRTHMMVALGSAVFMLTTIQFSIEFEPDSDLIRLDPIRSLAGIIGGVGFLGAGTIIEARGNVHGITTAASIWVAAAIGVACGMGMYRIAITTVILAILVLTVVGLLEFKAFDRDDERGAK